MLLALSEKPNNESIDLVCLSCTRKFHGYDAGVHALFRFHSRYVDDKGVIYTFSFNVKNIKKLLGDIIGLPKRIFNLLFNTIRKIGILIKKRKK